MEEKLDEIYENIKNRVFELIQTKSIDISALAFDLQTTTPEFMDNFTHRIDNMGFYFKALNLAENWEG